MRVYKISDIIAIAGESRFAECGYREGNEWDGVDLDQSDFGNWGVAPDDGVKQASSSTVVIEEPRPMPVPVRAGASLL